MKKPILVLLGIAALCLVGIAILLQIQQTQARQNQTAKAREARANKAGQKNQVEEAPNDSERQSEIDFAENFTIEKN